MDSRLGTREIEIQADISAYGSLKGAFVHQNDRLFTDGEAYERLMGR